jgi:hypothetical protein
VGELRGQLEEFKVKIPTNPAPSAFGKEIYDRTD